MEVVRGGGGKGTDPLQQYFRRPAPRLTARTWLHCIHSSELLACGVPSSSTLQQLDSTCRCCAGGSESWLSSPAASPMASGLPSATMLSISRRAVAWWASLPPWAATARRMRSRWHPSILDASGCMALMCSRRAGSLRSCAAESTANIRCSRWSCQFCSQGNAASWWLTRADSLSASTT